LCTAKAIDFDLLISVPKEPKESKLWGKRRSELIRVKSLDFFLVIHERCDDIFCATNQILQIQRMSENNESATQNADVAFQLRVIGQQLELLSKTYKDLKDEVNLVKQQNCGHWGAVTPLILKLIPYVF
jgi:hypothetical protein